MSIMLLFLIILILPFLCFYIYRRFFVFNFFEKEGIPGPKPHWLFGNVAEFADIGTRHLVVPRWSQKYGKLFGFYEGPEPTLVTSDPVFLSQCFVKQFPSFHAHKLMPIQPNPDAIIINRNEPVTMFVARGERWKRLRTIANPMFSTSKMKALLPLMLKCQHNFMTAIDRKVKEGEGGEIDIFVCFKLLTLETISETAFGIEFKSENGADERNQLLDTLNNVFQTMFEMPLMWKLSIIIPEIAPVLRQIELFRADYLQSGTLKPRERLFKMVTKIIALRKKQKQENKRQDLLQMMLDVERSRVDMIYGHKALSISEIIGQSTLFMLAGYETSSNALGFAIFLLANHQEVLAKLEDEIGAVFADDDAVDFSFDYVYDSIQSMPYLECVVNETLRLFPVAPLVVSRIATEDTVVNGVRIPKGTTVLADVWSLHRDEEQWGPVDPDLFYPERFCGDYPTKLTRHEAAFLSFGYGPRKCIGMRFALLEIKLTLINLLRKYRIEKTPRTGDHLKLQAGFTITPLNGIWIRLVKRKK